MTLQQLRHSTAVLLVAALAALAASGCADDPAPGLAVDDGTRREEFRMDHPTLAVHVPPMVWATQFKHTPDAMVLVLASHHYDPDDYIRDYADFLRAVGRA